VFQHLGHKSAIQNLVGMFPVNLTKILEDLVNATTSSIIEGKGGGEHDLLYEYFICQNLPQPNSKDICQTFFGGFYQVTWLMWLLALVLVINLG